jgi:CRP-like cAMP-binding protein
MNKCIPLYFIEETIQRIYREELPENAIYPGKEYYSSLLSLLFEKDMEFLKSNIGEIEQIILKKESLINNIRELTFHPNNKEKRSKISLVTGEIEEMLRKQEVLLKNIKEKFYPFNELILLDLYMKKIVPEITFYLTEKNSIKTMMPILGNDRDIDEAMKKDIAEVKKGFQLSLEEFYKEKEKITVKNEYEKEFVSFFGEENMLKHREIFLYEFIKFNEYVEEYFETRETGCLEKSFDALGKANYHLFCDFLLKEKLKNYSAIKEKESREFTLNISCPLRREYMNIEKSYNKIDIVKSTPFFNILSSGEIEKIANRIKLRRYEGQTVLFREGDRADNVYIIKSGEAGLYQEKDNYVDLISLRKGDVFGEMAVITKENRTLSARIKSQKAELYVISEDNFLSIVRSYPYLSVNLSRILCGKISEATDRLVNYLGDYYSYLKDKDILERSNKKSEILGSISLFSVLNQQELEKICARIKLRRYEGETVLFNEGDRAEEVYIIKSGEITLYRIFDRWDERSLITLHKGDILGEMGVLSDAPRSLSGKISSPKAELYTISKDDFLSIMRHYHQFSFNLAKILSYRIFDLNRRFFSIK